jgi:hypothetical protein
MVLQNLQKRYSTPITHRHIVSSVPVRVKVRHSTFSSGDSDSVISLSLGDFGCVFNLDGSYQTDNGSDGQVAVK